MNTQRHNIILMVLFFVGSISLTAWWNSKLPSMLATTWKSIPPEIPYIHQLSPLKADSGNASLERPLFWGTRRPRPPQNATSEASTSVPMELLGIAIEGNQRTALLRPKQGTPPLTVLRLHQGQSASGITLKSIDNDQVMLETASGTQTLQLKRGSQNPGFSNQPAKLSAPTSIEVTREKPLPTPQNRIDELKTKAAPQAQSPTPPKP